MTRNEAVRLTHQENVLLSLGFTSDEAEALRRISMTLRRWHERECGDGNGCIERDEGTGRTYWRNSTSDRRFPIPDREMGARKRLERITAERNKRAVQSGSSNTALGWYIQGDPRGAALYILRPGDVPEGSRADSCYSRGICVY